MSVKKKRTIGPCRGVTWLYYVVLLWSRDFFPPLYLDPRFRPLLLKFENFVVLKIEESCVLFVVVGVESEGDVSCRCLQSRQPQFQQKNVEISDLNIICTCFACSTSSKVGKFDFGKPYPKTCTLR